jgi:hypothetical protein
VCDESGSRNEHVIINLGDFTNWWGTEKHGSRTSRNCAWAQEKESCSAGSIPSGAAVVKTFQPSIPNFVGYQRKM